MWAYLNEYLLMQSCGEHRESGILKHGFFASPTLQDSNSLEAELETKKTGKGESRVVTIRHLVLSLIFIH